MKNSKFIYDDYSLIFALFIFLVFAGCNSGKIQETENVNDTLRTSPTTTRAATTKRREIDGPAIILNREQVPVLCYHQLRDWRETDSKTARDYIVPLTTFRDQIKMLADSGYHSILPDQLLAYLERGEALPEKPIMLTFDDTDLSQYTVAFPELQKVGFKGVFFIMTVSLNRPGYMSTAQVKELSQTGNTIGSHTWDHHNVKQYTEKDWVTQVEKPTVLLNSITGSEIKYFAYPFGLWKSASIPEIKKRGFAAAFQLSTKREENEPLYTIRRIIVPGSWNPTRLSNALKNSF